MAGLLQLFSLVNLLLHIGLGIIDYNNLDPPICQMKSCMCNYGVQMRKPSQMGGSFGCNKLKHTRG